MKRKNIPKKLLKGFYNYVPLKKPLCLGLRKLGIQKYPFYTALKFNGIFPVEVGQNRQMLLYHHGGTIENETFWKGLFNSWENDTGWIWKELCTCSEVIFDIGANIGLYSLVAKTINPTAKVVAFEPSVNIYNKLLKNNEINNFDIVCEQIALSNKAGEQTFYDIHNANQTTASLSPEKLKTSKKHRHKIFEYQVKSMTLAQYIKEKNINKIDLVKLDVELHEPAVIEGMGEYLKQHKPTVIIEVLRQDIADKLNELVDLNEFHIYHLEAPGKATRKKEFTVENKKWNFVFFHKDKEEMIRKHTSLF